MSRLLIVIFLTHFSVVCLAASFTTANLLDASALAPPRLEKMLLTPQGDAKWGFVRTSQMITPSPAGSVAAVGDELRLILGEEDALVGWGNYEGKQATEHRVHLPVRPLTVHITLKTTASGSITFLPSCDGKAGGKVLESKELRGENRKREKLQGLTHKLSPSGQWQTISFQTDSLKHSDGFELEFAGDRGTEVILKSARFSQHLYAGTFKKEFDFHRGKFGGPWQTWA